MGRNKGTKGRKSKSKQNKYGKTTTTTTTTSTSDGGNTGGNTGNNTGGNTGNNTGGNTGNNNNNNNNNNTKKKDSKITQQNIKRFGEQHVRNLQQKQKDFKSVRNKTMTRSDFASKHYGKGYGTTGNVGKSLQTRPETDRELERIAANIAAAEAAKKEATQKSMFSSERLKNTDAFNTSKFASNISASFTNPTVQNFGQNFGNWYNKGRLPNESKMSIRQLFNNDISQQQQIGKFNPNRKLNWASYARGESNPFRGMPGYGTITGQGQVEGGFQTGPTPSVRQAIERPAKAALGIGKFLVNPKVAILGSLMKPTALADGTLKGKPGFETQAGGLNIGDNTSETEGGRNIRSLKKLSQVTDIGEKRDESKDAFTNSLLSGAYNIATKVPFIGPQIKNIREDTKPYTDRIKVETPKETKKAISDFVGNLDSMSDTTRRFVNEFATDNPNIPNVAGFETAADVVQTFNPMNKNYAPQLRTNLFNSPLEAIANNFVAGGTKNIFQEAALNVGAEGTISPAEGLSIAKQIGKNINTPGTLGNFEATKLQELADKYGGGTVKPTPGTILRGIRGGSGRPVGQVRSGGSLPSVASSLLQQQQQQPVEELPLLTDANRPDLQNIQQQAYNQQMSAYGVPNYMAQFQPTQRVRPLRRRQYFNRDYFTQFA